MKLSILICTIPKRAAMFGRLMSELWSQVLPFAGEVEIMADDNATDSIGMKRNRLLQKATGVYVCFIDDDDNISVNYIELLIGAIESGCDCASLKGVYSVDNRYDGIFEHSIMYNEWRTTGNEIKYERYPNHLNMIRASIAQQFKFPEINHGEDADWSTQIFKSGLLKTEYYIDDILYYYRKINNHVQPEV